MTASRGQGLTLRVVQVKLAAPARVSCQRSVACSRHHQVMFIGVMWSLCVRVGVAGKVKSLSVSLGDKIKLGPPPAAIGSDEWLRQQAEEKAAAATAVKSSDNAAAKGRASRGGGGSRTAPTRARSGRKTAKKTVVSAEAMDTDEDSD